MEFSTEQKPDYKSTVKFTETLKNMIKLKDIIISSDIAYGGSLAKEEFLEKIFEVSRDIRARENIIASLQTDLKWHNVDNMALVNYIHSSENYLLSNVSRMAYRNIAKLNMRAITNVDLNTLEKYSLGSAIEPATGFYTEVLDKETKKPIYFMYTFTIVDKDAARPQLLDYLSFKGVSNYKQRTNVRLKYVTTDRTHVDGFDMPILFEKLNDDRKSSIQDLNGFKIDEATHNTERTLDNTGKVLVNKIFSNLNTNHIDLAVIVNVEKYINDIFSNNFNIIEWAKYRDETIASGDYNANSIRLILIMDSLIYFNILNVYTVENRGINRKLCYLDIPINGGYPSEEKVKELFKEQYMEPCGE